MLLARYPNELLAANGEHADDYEVIGCNETHRLAQLPGSYQVLIYRKQVWRKKDNGNILTPKAPANVLEGTYADEGGSTILDSSPSPQIT